MSNKQQATRNKDQGADASFELILLPVAGPGEVV
jgi:hypothetical protein